MDAASLVIFIGLLIFVSHLFTGIFERRGIPDVLLLMIIGIVVGPVFGFVTPESFGIVTGIFTTITLVFILFQGGLDLRIETLKSSIRGTSLLTVLNFAATTVVVGCIGWLLIGMEPIPAFILGAILGGTSSAVVIPLVKQLKMKDDSRTILVLESALSDVLCIVFVLALIQAYNSEGIQVGVVIGSILSSFVLASIIGIASALVWSVLLGKVRTIQNSMFTTPAFVFVIYGLAEQLGFSGAIAALAFGVSLANIDLFKFRFVSRFRSEGLLTFNDTEKQFFSEIVFLLKTFFFVFIGISIQFSNGWAMLLGIFITLIIYIIRIPTVKYAIYEPLPTVDLTIMATMVPKGLAAAVLANLPLQNNIPGGEMIRDLTYAVILTSIVLTSILIPLLNRVPAISAFYGLILRTRRKGKLKAAVEGMVQAEIAKHEHPGNELPPSDKTEAE